MAKKTIVELVDDLDGSAAEETVRFAVDGVWFEIDLSTANADVFRKTLQRTWPAWALSVGPPQEPQNCAWRFQ